MYVWVTGKLCDSSLTRVIPERLTAESFSVYILARHVYFTYLLCFSLLCRLCLITASREQVETTTNRPWRYTAQH